MRRHSPDRQVDVLVIGGGMVGASLALALASKLRPAPTVMVVEPRPPLSSTAAEQPSFDARSTALSLSSVDFYRSLGLWRKLERRAQAINSVHVSDRGRFGSTLMDRSESGLAALGYVVENPWLGQVLYDALARTPQVELLAPARLRDIDRASLECRIELSDRGEACSVSADLVVLADGADSSACRALGISQEQRETKQQAVIANLVHRRDHEGRAYERFTRRGPIALLPLPADSEGGFRSALIWVCETDRSPELMALSASEFLDRLQRVFGYRAGRFLRLGERQRYPLRLSRAREQVRPRLVVLGNAAHTLHPVAGQGFNLSLRDLVGLSAVLGEARSNGRPLGDPAMLQRYLQRQSGDQQGTSRFSELLPALFGSGDLGLALARDAGLIGLDLMAPLRRGFVHLATGYGRGAAEHAG